MLRPPIAHRLEREQTWNGGEHFPRCRDRFTDCTTKFAHSEYEHYREQPHEWPLPLASCSSFFSLGMDTPFSGNILLRRSIACSASIAFRSFCQASCRSFLNWSDVRTCKAVRARAVDARIVAS